ncbi:hypothetical protein [Catenuloplanes japonicus]|uniref:hypothetical protein n=1 Tax=Catenuloplanes japonicus TaxID=33876 RepID=UPI0012F966CB|nr:hypothetical protein [Catenuloplanes japonicus]
MRRVDALLGVKQSQRVWKEFPSVASMVVRPSVADAEASARVRSSVMSVVAVIAEVNASVASGWLPMSY